MDNEELVNQYNVWSQQRKIEQIQGTIRNILWETLAAKRLTVVRKEDYRDIQQRDKESYQKYLKGSMYRDVVKLLENHMPSITETTEKEMVTDYVQGTRQEDVTTFRLEYMVITPEDYKNLVLSLYAAVEQAML